MRTKVKVKEGSVFRNAKVPVEEMARPGEQPARQFAATDLAMPRCFRESFGVVWAPRIKTVICEDAHSLYMLYLGSKLYALGRKENTETCIGKGYTLRRDM